MASQPKSTSHGFTFIELLVVFLLMIVGRLAGLVLPATSKFLVDDVIGNARADLLAPLAAAAGLATLVQASTGFAISQIL